MTMIRFGAALLGALLSIAIPASAGDGCCGEAKEEKAVAAATPQECFKAAACAIQKGDTKALASQLSVKSNELAAKKGEEKAGVEEKGGCCGDEKDECCEITDVKIDGDKATAVCPIGQPLAFVKEDGAWKLDISAMFEKDCCGEGKCEEKPKE